MARRKASAPRGARWSTTCRSRAAKAAFPSLPLPEAIMSLDATSLAHRTAVVLGGPGGFGLAVAQSFADAGAGGAVVASTDMANAEGVALSLAGAPHHGHTSRIENADELAALALAVKTDMGGVD